MEAVRVAPGTKLLGVTPIKRRARGPLGVRWIDLIWLVAHAALLSQCIATAGGPRLRAEEVLAGRKAELAELLAQEGGLELFEHELELFELGASDLSSRPLTMEELEASPLPHESLPDFFPLTLMVISVLLHIVFLLSLRWMPAWKARVDYTSTGGIERGCQVLVHPLPNCGVTRIVELYEVKGEWLQAEDGGDADVRVAERFGFIYNHGRFELVKSDEGVWTVSDVVFPAARDVERYQRTLGLIDDCDEPRRLQKRFGKNSLDIPAPAFVATFVEQLLGPVPCFQMFCCSLWFLDAYWYYALFSLFMVAMLEASTAFQRVKSVQSLRALQTSSQAAQTAAGAAPDDGGAADVNGVWAYRGHQWCRLSSKLELVPGDVFSIPSPISDDAAGADGDDGPEPTVMIPCDAVILRGSAVVSEASLTGEAAPQMKEALQGHGRVLDMDGQDKVSVLHSGTTLVQASGGDGRDNAQKGSSSEAIPSAPDKGVICFCIRTGFGSSQGQLVRMLENSGASVRGDSKETLALFTLLLFMASLASLQVLRAGLNDPSRSPYEVLLRCVLILTSVVPPELPMQAAAAVHAALLSLHRQKIFCTEPHRVPLAGHVTAVLFDKTGTITTDHLTLAGFSPPIQAALGGEVSVTPPAEANEEARLVIAACHSLVAQSSRGGAKLVGDPIEVAGMEACMWQYDAKSQTASVKEDIAVRARSPTRARILHRYHFASALQRMSVIAKVDAERKGMTMALVKGSPEAVLDMLHKGDNDAYREAYMRLYRSYAEKGMRILALAVKHLDEISVRDPPPRDEVESGLHFVGFAVFMCRPRRDSTLVISNLRGGAMKVLMVTGDAPQTALYIAQTCGMTGDHQFSSNIESHGEDPVLKLAEDGAGWEELLPAMSSSDVAPRSFPFDVDGVSELATRFTLVVTGSGLRSAIARIARSTGISASAATANSSEEDQELLIATAEAELWAPAAEHVVVYARMTPSDKELLALALAAAGHRTFMCGDGANDVGALRRADIGLALLSGFGTANTAGDGEKLAHEMTEEDKKKEKQKILKRRKERREKVAEKRKTDRAELQTMQKQFFEEELRKAEQAGESFASAKAMGRAMKRTVAFQRERIAKQKRRGEVGFGAEAAWLAEEMGGLDNGGLPVIQLGDASVAAPFTSKLPSTSGVVDIIRQGRCTLASMVQNQQILVLTCLISAYSLSALYTDNVRMAEAQMMVTGMLLSVASIAFSFARPVEKLAPVRPLGSIFHPANAASTIGQLVIALVCLAWAVSMTKAYTDEFGVITEPYERPAWLEQVIEDMAAITGAQEQEEGLISRPFRPSLLNTVVFLVETAQQVSVIMVNYRGRPFMLASTENLPMILSLLACAGIILAAGAESFPELNGALRLVPLPSNEFRFSLLTVLLTSIFGAILVDRLASLLFAPHLAVCGYVEAYHALPTVQGFIVGLVKVLAATAVILVVVGSGQWLLGMFLAYMYYRYRKGQETV